MADIVVPVFMENFTKLLGHEPNLLLEVKDQVCLLQDDLGIINTFLKDSDVKCDQDDHHRDNHYGRSTSESLENLLTFGYVGIPLNSLARPRKR
ncbi:hypothetical protein FEM48_Zijuj12G0185200 [Ziziphus jujuba var. spinosa]|uniref:Disease resistance N-terminal domain-containing protein n=1 Tax=Ziziphus jujuba var. spinosa TaxID=714518 RepID=A0A978UEV4_ZIZJJ|nr:hypothetical protein FEM48_Zijuj12G0185200 [Ziziphus jujuba var. spinosa]